MTEQQPPHTGFAEINGARLRYEIAGSGPPLVLVHARITDSGMWDEQWQALAEHFTVLRYDLRGHGQSVMPSDQYSHVADLAGLLQCLKIDRAHVIGVSMGGEIALDFALEHPGRVATLVAVACAPSGYQWSAALEPKWAAIFAALEQGDFAGAIELELKLWVDGPQRKPEQVDPGVRERVRAMDTANWQALAEYRHRAQPAPSSAPPAVARLGDIGAPTLVVVGDADEPDILAGADLLAAQIPLAEKVVVAGGGHMLTMEQPDVFNQAVRAFLSRHTARTTVAAG